MRKMFALFSKSVQVKGIRFHNTGSLKPPVTPLKLKFEMKILLLNFTTIFYFQCSNSFKI